MELRAPSHWSCIDFISDLHLQASEPLTFEAWRDYLLRTRADAVFILGDLFEVWVGDDAVSNASGFEQHCADILRRASGHLSIYIMQGNRDFLMGPALMAATGCHFLEEPSTLTFAEQRWLLAHGDALCLADTQYMAFRALVRSDAWKEEFLSRPIGAREDIARGLRQQSEAHKMSESSFTDVDSLAAGAMLRQADATTLVHGHTHQPATHTLGSGMQRIVLSDWDLAAQPPRSQVLRLTRGAVSQAKIERISPLSA